MRRDPPQSRHPQGDRRRGILQTSASTLDADRFSAHTVGNEVHRTLRRVSSPPHPGCSCSTAARDAAIFASRCGSCANGAVLSRPYPDTMMPVGRTPRCSGTTRLQSVRPRSMRCRRRYCNQSPRSGAPPTRYVSGARSRNPRTIAAASTEACPHSVAVIHRAGKKMSPVCWMVSSSSRLGSM